MSDKPTYEELEQRLKELEEEAVKRKHAEEPLVRGKNRLKKLLDLFQLPGTSERVLTSFIVEECIKITESKLGFLGFINEEETLMSAQLWSEKAMESCAIDEKPLEFSLGHAGLWVEAIRQHKPIIVNDYQQPDPLKKGLPEGHVPLTRLMSVPLIKGDRAVAIVALANKSKDYTETELLHVSLFLESVWEMMQRKQAAENLKEEKEFTEKALNTQLDTFFAFNPATGKAIRWNKAFEEVSGYSNEEIAQMKAPDSYYDQQDLAKAAKAVALILENGSGTIELEFICKNGRKIPFEYVVSVIYNELEQPENFISIGRDITERKLAEVALQKAHNGLESRVEERTAELMSVNEKLNQEIEIRKQTEKDLEESTQKIKLFAYSVSHDLKSPTISIYGLTKRLSRLYGNILDEKGKTCCDQILKASEQIVGLAENINVYISTKEAPITIENVNLKELFQMVREEIAPQLSIRKIKWFQPDHLPEIRADRLSIVRVIRNLVDNALKYGGDDLSEISIGYQKSDESHILSVMDDGIGLKAGDSKEIFDTFKRTETSRGIEGAGLGLAIVKEIAERHAGKIWMKRGPERGINFRVSISRNLQLSR